MRRQVSTYAAAVDDQCGQRRRLVEVEARLPASDRAIAVEPGLVRDERPDDAADPGGTDLEREVPKARGRQGRIAGPCQHELAVPDRPVLSTLTDHVGLVPVARAEDRERREGDGQLFVRRWRDGVEAAVAAGTAGVTTASRARTAARRRRTGNIIFRRGSSGVKTMGLRKEANGPRGPCARQPESRYWSCRFTRPWPRMIENSIRTVLEAPEAGEGAPTPAHIEHLLTSGYARAMAIEGEQWRLQRRIVDVALQLADEYNELQARDLRKLARELREVDEELVSIRALIRSLRTRTNAP